MTLVNKLVRITSDNENYIDWIDRDLYITYASNNGNGYDTSMYPQMLCDLQDAHTGKIAPLPFTNMNLKESLKK